MVKVVLLIGDSNQRGAGLGPRGQTWPATTRMRQLGRFGADDMQIVPVVEVLQHAGNDRPAGRGYEISAGHRWLDRYPDDEIVFVPCAQGGSACTHYTTSALWTNVVARAASAVAQTQGTLAWAWESEGSNPIDAILDPTRPLHNRIPTVDAYEEAKRDFMEQFRAEFGALPFFNINPAPEWLTRPDNTKAQRRIKESVCNRIQKIANEDANYYFVGIAGALSNGPDLINPPQWNHIRARSMDNTVGKKMNAAMMAAGL